jgi:general secretion pathway protein B
MSYILDALKKAEQQRPPGRGPELFTVHGPRPPRRFPWLPFAGAGLLACAVALGVWIGHASREPAAVPAAAPAVSVEARSVPLPAVPASRPQPEPARLPADHPRPAVPAGAGTKPLAAPAAAPPPAETPHPAGAPGAGLPAVAPAAVPAVPSPAAPAAPAALPAAVPAPAPLPAPAPTPAAVPAPPASPPPPPAPAEPAAPPAVEPKPEHQELPAPPPPESPPPDGRIVELAELPAAVRGEIGEVRLAAHVWSEEPSLRLVSVQDRILREGAEVRPGLRLEEITPEGAVLGFRGYRFRIGGSAR